MSIKLEELPFEYEGKEYILRCNMNVLADVQDAYDGNIGAALNEKRPLNSVTKFLAAMMNDYAEEQNWPERVTARQVGHKLSRAFAVEIMALVVRSITPESIVGETDAEPADTGN